MRGISRRVLARDAAARVERGVCAGMGAWWNALEKQHGRAADQKEAAALVREARKVACDHCPALMACDAWARAEEYTGIAAGSPYDTGERKAMSWVPRRRPGRRPKDAAIAG